MAGLFRARGVLSNDAKYAVPARVLSVQEILNYRSTWGEQLPAPEFSFEAIMAKARAPPETKPVEKLQMTENGFHITDQSRLSEKEKIVRHIQSVLNKLTETNYEALIATCLEESSFDESVIESWVARIFEKALEEPKFCPLYAKVAFDMAKYEFDKFQKKHVRTAIVQKAQSVHEQDISQASSTSEGQQRPASDDEVATADKLRKKKLANIKLIGELYKGNLLTNRIIVVIVTDVLNKEKRPAEMDVEMVTELLKNVGSILETKQNVDPIYERVKMLMDIQPPYAKRVIFAMMNLLDLRKAKWVEKHAVDAAPPPPPQLPPPAKILGTSPVADHVPPLPGAKKASGPQLTFQPLPTQLDPEVEADIEKRFPAAAMDQFSPAEKIQALLKEVRTKSGGTRDAMTVFCAATFACRQTKEDIGEAIFSAFQLPKGTWEPGEVSIGLAWCIATAIVDDVVGDTPKFFPRLAVFLVKTGWSLDRIIHDVYGRAATCLDSVYPKGQCDSQERNRTAEIFGELWDLIIKAVAAPPAPSEGASTEGKGTKSPTVTKATPAQVLDSLGSCKMTTFLRELLTDMLDTLRRLGVCPQEAFTAWRKSKANPNEDVAVLCKEIDDMV